jgi:disulfide bond formation protein DsbB
MIVGANTLGLYAVLLASVMAFAFQFYYNELPCPLCMLQRMGLLLAAFGFMLNFKYGFKASHYGFSLFGLLLMMAVGMRQVFLHIVPGSGSYGSSFLGLHLYTWVVLMGVLGIFYIAVVLLCHNRDVVDAPLSKSAKIWGNIAGYGILVLVLLNLINAFMICGFGGCPDNPVAYTART